MSSLGQQVADAFVNGHVWIDVYGNEWIEAPDDPNVLIPVDPDSTTFGDDATLNAVDASELGPLDPKDVVFHHTSDDSGEVRTVSKTGGEKGAKLARFDLIPWDAVWEVAEHFGRGARKYADRNWERGYEWGKSFAALHRHLAAWHMGEDIDPETGSNHMVAVAWHALVITHFILNEQYAEYDDRPGGVT